MECISYQDHGVDVLLQPLPYHPIKDREHIRKYLSLYAWHSSESNLFNLGITNKMLRSVEPTDLSAPLMLFEDAIELAPGLECLSLPIQEVLSKRVLAGRVSLERILFNNLTDFFNYSQCSQYVYKMIIKSTTLLRIIVGTYLLVTWCPTLSHITAVFYKTNSFNRGS